MNYDAWKQDYKALDCIYTLGDFDLIESDRDYIIQTKSGSVIGTFTKLKAAMNYMKEISSLSSDFRNLIGFPS